MTNWVGAQLGGAICVSNLGEILSGWQTGGGATWGSYLREQLGWDPFRMTNCIGAQLWSVNNSLFSIFYTLYSILYILYSILYILFSIFYSLYSILYILYSIFYTLYSILYILFSIFYILFSIISIANVVVKSTNKILPIISILQIDKSYYKLNLRESNTKQSLSTTQIQVQNL